MAFHTIRPSFLLCGAARSAFSLFEISLEMPGGQTLVSASIILAADEGARGAFFVFTHLTTLLINII